MYDDGWIYCETLDGVTWWFENDVTGEILPPFITPIKREYEINQGEY